MSLARFQAAIDIFRDMESDVPASMIATFLIIAENEKETPEGCPLLLVTKNLGMSPSAVSRNIAALTKELRRGRPGLGLAEIKESRRDRRFKMANLTPRGMAVKHRLIQLLER